MASHACGIRIGQPGSCCIGKEGIRWFRPNHFGKGKAPYGRVQGQRGGCVVSCLSGRTHSLEGATSYLQVKDDIGRLMSSRC